MIKFQRFEVLSGAKWLKHFSSWSFSKMAKVQRACCQTIFVFKALIAVALGIAAIVYQVNLVMSKYRTCNNLYNLAIKPLPNVDFPPLGSADATKCYFNAAQKGSRLEPPANSFFFGFSPKWVDGELPEDIVNQLGYTPPLFK